MRGFKLVISLALSLALSVSVSAQTVKDPTLRVQEYTTGLSAPVNMAFLGSDDILILQKNDGRVRRAIGGVLQAGHVLDLNVDNSSERGLLGIALHPQFPATPLVYLYFTESSTTGDTAGSPAPLANRVASFTWNGTSLINRAQILDLPVSPGPNHDGGIIRFGPDGKLYVVIGDLNRTGQLQNFPGGDAPDNTSVILRVNADGSTPTDNPFFNEGGNVSKYFAYGIRNSFGMAFDPLTDHLWMSENGPNFYDEINVVRPGFNSGWQQLMGPDSRDQQGIADLFMLPEAHYSDPAFSWLGTVGPTALEFQSSTRLGAQHTQQLFAGDINNGTLYRFQMNSARNGFVFQGAGLTSDLVADDSNELEEVVFGGGFGGITDIKVGPDGLLYVLSYSGRIYVISPLVTVTRTLAVASANPNSGINIVVSPNDNNGASSGTTPFNRTYNDGALVNLAAPSTANGRAFLKWQRDGIDHSTSQNTQVSMDANHTMTALYASEIVIDNAPAGQSGNGASFTGKWCDAKDAMAFGPTSLQSCGKQLDAYRWTPTIPGAGNYDVYIWWSAHRNRSTSVPFTVCHTAACVTVNMNQQQNGGRWNLHGRYNFATGSAGYVQVTDQNGRAIADAVRLVPAP